MKRIAVFIWLMAIEMSAYAAGADKYVVVHLRSAYDSQSDAINEASPGGGEPFDRGECAEKILENFQSGSWEYFNNYAKNGVIIDKSPAKGNFKFWRYVCVPETALKYKKDKDGHISGPDFESMKGIPNTIDEGKLDSYTILPLDEESVARPQTDKLNEAVARTVFEPSFSCGDLSALRPNERLVCKSQRLAKQDRRLSELYKKVLDKLDADQGGRIRKDQREWIKSTREAEYADRLGVLYYKRIVVLEDALAGCSGAREIISNLTTRRGDADKAALAACLENRPDGDMRAGLRVESGFWLGYLYLDEQAPEKADKYIKMALDILKANCPGDGFDNFCHYYGLGEYSYGEELPAKFDTKEKLYPPLLLTTCISYDVIEREPKIADHFGGKFYSTRDSYVRDVCGDDLPAKYQWVSIEDITKLDNYRKIAKGLNEYYGEEETGSMRFGVYKDRFALKLRLAMFPNGIDRTEKRFSLEEFAVFEEEMGKYPDVRKAYLAAVEKTKAYYKRVLEMPEAKAAETAAFAVQLLIVWDCHVSNW